MAVPALAVSASAAADKAAKVEDAGKDAEKPFSPLDNCGNDLWQLSCDCPQGYLMTPWDSSHELYPGDIGHVWFTRGMSYWADHGNIAYERLLPDRNGSDDPEAREAVDRENREQDGETRSLSEP